MVCLNQNLWKKKVSIRSKWKCWQGKNFFRGKSLEKRDSKREIETQFFYNSINVRRSSNKFFSIKNSDGVMLSNQKEIQEAVVGFFQQLLMEENPER